MVLLTVVQTDIIGAVISDVAAHTQIFTFGPCLAILQS